MAHDEQDREDLLTEATALVERAELSLNGAVDHVVVGFRSNDAASVFYGGDPVYQFNPSRQLRRAYVDGILYKANQGSLVALTRQRTPTEVVLQRRDLDAEESAEFLAKMATRLRQLLSQLEQGQLADVGQVPTDRDVVGRIQATLRDLVAAPVAASPRVG